MLAATEGRAPYDDQVNALAVLNAIAHDPPPEPTRAGPLTGPLRRMLDPDPTTRATMQESAAALRAAGATRAIAWVPERDVASRRFYERAGWDPDGTVRTLDAGGRPLREIRVGGTLDLEFRPEPSLDDLDLPLLP